MKVNVYDTELNRVLFLDNTFISLLWKPHYNKIGNFTLEVAETDTNKLSIKPDYYVSVSDDDNLMVIKTVETKDNKIVASGFSATRVLYDVAFIGTIEAGQNVPTAIKSAYAKTSGFPLIRIADSNLNVKYLQQISHKSIGELCEIMCGATDLGFKSVKNGKNIDIVFYQPEENPNLIFAEKYGNIKNSSLLISTNAYKNYAIVLGQGEGEDRIKVFVDIRTSQTEQRRDLIVDAKDLQKAENETQEQYIKRLEARGIEKLLNQQIKKDVNFLPYITQNGVVGEIITVLLEDFGIKLKTRIISMQIKEQNNVMQKIFDVGEITSYSNVTTTTSGSGGGSSNGEIGALYPVGSVFITSTNENPASLLGGTWELFDKTFSNVYGTKNDWIAIDETNTTSTSFYVVRSGHTARIRITFTNLVSISDTEVNIGTIDLKTLGFNTLLNSIRYTGSTDAGNVIFMGNIAYNTGIVTVTDIVGVDTVAANTTGWIIDIVLQGHRAVMLDNACDKFYWKRIE